MIDLRLGDCMDIMRGMDADSVDAVVTDPPAGISFMGKSWDSDKGGRDNWIAWMSEIAAECLRVLKPGGYALVWSLPRTSHWTGMAWENGGFEPRDRIAYCFGSGFPKSLDVSKAIDKAAGAERETIGIPIYPDGTKARKTASDFNGQLRGQDTITAPATDAAREWAGWGTALKPAIEDWWVFRKPLSEATVAANVLRWGTGALNIDASRVFVDDSEKPAIVAKNDSFKGRTSDHIGVRRIDATEVQDSIAVKDEIIERTITLGRFPANLVTDSSSEVVAMFPQTTTHAGTNEVGRPNGGVFTGRTFTGCGQQRIAGTGSAARFFKSCPLDEDDYPPLYYCAKASKAERDAGCEDLLPVVAKRTQDGGDDTRGRPMPINHNHHPTVKPLSLMRYLITLCTHEGATVLDPFMGSGTTGAACVQLNRNFIGCEIDPNYFEIAKRRIEAAQPVAIALPLMVTA